MHYRISTIIWSLEISGFRSYCSMISAGIFINEIRIYSLQFMSVKTQQSLMSRVRQDALISEMTESRCNLIVWISAVGVVTTPGKSILFPPTVKRTRQGVVFLRTDASYYAEVGDFKICRFFRGVNEKDNIDYSHHFRTYSFLTIYQVLLNTLRFIALIVVLI